MYLFLLIASNVYLRRWFHKPWTARKQSSLFWDWSDIPIPVFLGSPETLPQNQGSSWRSPWPYSCSTTASIFFPLLIKPKQGNVGILSRLHSTVVPGSLWKGLLAPPTLLSCSVPIPLPPLISMCSWPVSTPLLSPLPFSVSTLLPTPWVTPIPIDDPSWGRDA